MTDQIGHSRRKFLRNSALALGAFAGGGLLDPMQASHLLETSMPVGNRSLEAWSSDEDFWHQVRLAYTVSPSLINLNNGGVSPSPEVVQDAVERYMQLSNETPSYYMWRILDQGREPLRERLAAVAGVSPEEIAINRNASEALETAIFGLRLEKGDEVVLSKQDYPNMINAWKQREKRDGIVLKWVDHQLPGEDDAAMAQRYFDLFTDKTKVVHITHVINWTGQVLPSKMIADKAHDQGIEVVVDAAHSFAHLVYKIPDTGADYFGTSLHKWLCAPIGTGLLYVKKEKIGKLFPLFGAPDPESEDIRKFEALGTRSFPLEQGIGQALDFHEWLDAERKFARLHHLKTYWLEQALDLGYHSYTSLDPQYSGAIANIGWKDVPPQDIANYLFREYKIHAVAINWEDIHGVRITPHVYTNKKELDKLVSGLHAFAREHLAKKQ